MKGNKPMPQTMTANLCWAVVRPNQPAPILGHGATVKVWPDLSSESVRDAVEFMAHWQGCALWIPGDDGEMRCEVYNVAMPVGGFHAPVQLPRTKVERQGLVAKLLERARCAIPQSVKR